MRLKHFSKLFVQFCVRRMFMDEYRTMEDKALLQEYARSESEPAFTALVERHAGLVYSSALRLMRDPHLAEDGANSPTRDKCGASGCASQYFKANWRALCLLARALAKGQLIKKCG